MYGQFSTALKHKKHYDLVQSTDFFQDSWSYVLHANQSTNNKNVKKQILILPLCFLLNIMYFIVPNSFKVITPTYLYFVP